ncbi:SDR family NAD(P)-dependent oxidoreductase [Streptomyces sp. CYG20]|nr:SDR family NAD(P)-dependent oxidoreductase [Streptomyces sp. COG20]MBT3085160.1 SDR family NAD(P)-dependent oxidoreductase [Streptomyces sp. CYG21]MBT3100411.1 SDR family NAD(P)-dependent oxidoreductase [Streptomyces sp. CBG30]MBT3105597.1 SDR family NAD(P)-dependent oxidoreductase [Streptomyces sp. COG19]MBT3114008.1 SDR family NAD(P)-dependent oxidoreductase [Streptomyces sp. CYG20]
MAHPDGTEAPLLWTLAGNGKESLAAGARGLHTYLAGRDDWSPQDIALALARTASEGSRRAALVADGRDGFLRRLDALADGRSTPGLLDGAAGAGGRVAFVFPGQGAQWPRMAVDLLDTSTVFRDRMDACAQALEPFVDWSPLDVLRDPDAPGAPAGDRADVVQPLLFAVTVSLAALWRSHGVEPAAVLGHSVGEVTAAAVSGALSLDDSARVVALWSQAQATLAGQGDMVSVMAPAAEVEPRLHRWEGRLVVAAHNGPRSVIVSGDRDAAAELLDGLAADAVHARRIAVGLAAHSPHIDAIIPRMRADLAPIHPRTPHLPYYSGLTGGRLDAPVLDADYWCRNLRNTVRFHQAARALLRDGHGVLLEVSPHTVLTSALTDCVEEHGVQAAVLGTLRRDQDGPGRFLTSLGDLYVRGVAPQREAPSAVEHARLPELPAAVLAALAETGPADVNGPDGTGGDGDAATAFRAELAAMDVRERRAVLARLVGEEIAALTGRSDPVPAELAFLDLGFDSVTAVELRNRLGAATALRIPATVVFDCPTPAALTAYLCAEISGDRPDTGADTNADTDTVEPVRRRSGDDDPVVIVGMGCRYPGGVGSPDELWELVSAGADAVSALPDDRGWDTAGRYDPTPGTPGRYYQREAGSLAGAAEFDAEFFGISPREAAAMDPQQRLLLETTWEVLERAGIDPATLRRTPTGVYVGAMTMDYGPSLEQGADEGGHLLTGNTGSVASGRLAYTLGLEGAAVTVDTACSSSLVALHLAVRALRSGECSLALAGGATVMPTVGMLVEFSRQGGLAPDGRCKAFAAAADGFGLAEGVGMLLLERLSDARRHGHPVLAVVRGSATNQDGASNGLTAPSGPSQQRVIRAALADAGLTASDVDVVEAHGTGTRLGDPIEAQALLATYGQDRSVDRPVWIGSLKSNIGHTQAAAGVGGVIKSVLAIRHGVMPKTLHVDGPTPEVDWSAGAGQLLTEARTWDDAGRPRRAGVSSFGISGTNAHVILESAPAEAPAGAVEDARRRPGAVVWPVSARSAEALRAQAGALAARVVAEPALDVADVGYSLAVGRASFEHRAAVVGGDRSELLRGVKALAEGRSAQVPGLVRGGGVSSGRSVLVFPGQGSQWVGMAAELLGESEVFAGRMGECERALSPYVDWSLAEALGSERLLARVDVVQPVLWAVMVSLAEVWRSFGVAVDGVVGHSQGEVAAACVAGGLSLEDGARVVALRSRAVGVLAGRGGMASVPLPVDVVRERIALWAGRLSVAAVNGPSSTVVSGDADAVAGLLEELAGEGVRARRVEVDYASHSSHVEEIREQLLSDLKDISPRSGSVSFYSSVTGGLLDTKALDAEYWYRNLRETVEFEQATGALLADGFRFFVEASPHPVLGVAVGESVEAAGVEAAVLGTLRRGEGGQEQVLRAVGRAWECGLDVDWSGAFPGARRVELPTYAFQRSRYWLTAPAAVPAAPAEDRWDELESQDPAQLAETLGVGRAALDEVLPALASWRSARSRERKAESWRYHVAWAPLSVAPADGLAGRWLALRPESDDAAAVLDALGEAGADLLPCVVDDPGATRGQLAALLTETAETTETAGEQPIAGVLSLLSWEERPHPDHPDLPGGPALTLALAQALEDTGIDARLWTLTKGTAVLGGAERPGHVGQAASAALGRTLALEHPHRPGGLVDLPEVLDVRAARRLCAVLAGAVADEEQVAVRSTGVHGRRLRPAPPSAPPKAGEGGAADRARTRPLWKGTVLVTGGTGGVGSHTARWLAGQGAERLLLVSRRGADAPGTDALRAELTALGAEVAFAACDVADPAALAALVAGIPARSPLSAVVHAAGVLDDGVLDALDPARLAVVLRAKLTAARNLHEATADLDLSAFVVFSSVMGVVGNAGQGNYAAANAALDALVAARRAAGLPGTSVAWGAWAGPGMLADEVAARLRDFGMPVMEPETAVTAIGRALAEDDALVVVADVDWRRFATSTGLRSAALLDGIPDAAAAGPAPGTTAPSAARETVGSADALRQRIAVLPRHEDRVRALTELVRAHAATVLRHPDADAVRSTQAFSALGFDSLTAVELRNRLAAATGLALPAAVLFDHPTPSALADRLLADLGLGLGVELDLPDAASNTAGFARSAGAEAGRTAEPGSGEPIAIVGMGCRFPGGVARPEDFWHLVSKGIDAVGDWPSNRGWDTEGLYDPDPDRPGTTYTRQGGFLHDVPDFDAEFFGISPREALAMDPQQRLLLETAWEAVEGAGQDPTALKDRQVGVYIGTNGQDYSALLEGAEGISEGHLLTGNTASVLSGRLSYVLGLQGPALTVDTACSSSLVALHLAVQALRRGDCEQALAGGVSVMSTPRLFVEFSRQRGLAADGRCKAFSADADGTGWGEGAGVLLLERHSDALRHGHPVLALISGTAVNQDGASNGLTAPNGPSQQQVIRAALADAALRADQIDAIEAHGTGTKLGDPIEAQALQAVHGPARPADRPLWLGSVKSNIGHTQAAAGVAGVMKMVLAIRHGELPGTLHAGTPNPHVDWSGGGIRLLTAHTPWPETGSPRRAGVSSFGISGTNAHVIIEQAPALAAVPALDRADAQDRADVPGRTDAADRAHALGRTDAPDRVEAQGRGDALGRTDAPGRTDAADRTDAQGRADVPGRIGAPVLADAQDRTGTPDGDIAPDTVATAATALAAVTATPTARRTGPPVPLLLSARTPEALRAQAGRLVSRFDADPDLEPADVAYSLATGRAPLEHRAAVLGRDRAAVRRALTALARGTSAGRLLTGGAVRSGRTAFLFPGQGSQRAGAGAELYRDDPVFADALDEVLTGLDPHLDLPLRDILFAAPGTPGAELLDRTRYTQPALFALETALFRLVRHWGVRPDLLMGHSIGELAAAHAAGVLDLPDACALVAARGRLMDELPGGGAMVAVEATEDEVRRALLDDRTGHPAPEREAERDGVDIAAVNGPASVVLSGDADAVRRLAGAFRSRGRRTRRLSVSHAFHSARMDGMLDAFRDVAESLTYRAPGIEIVSNLTGRTATAAELCSPDHWVRHVRGTVRFLEGARRLRAEGATTYVEIGPGGVLSGMLHGCLSDPDPDAGFGPDLGPTSAPTPAPDPGDTGTVPLLRDGRDEPDAVRTALASLYLRGVEVDWSVGWSGTDVRRVDLPTYAFQRRRFWPEAAPDPAPAAWRRRGSAGPAGPRRYRIAWEPLAVPEEPRVSGRWLLVTPDGPGAEDTALACEQALAGHGADVVVMRVGAAVERAELALMLPEFGVLAGVLSLLALADDPHPGPRTPDACLTGTLLLLQALGDSGIDAPLWCATRGAVAADGTEEVRPGQAQVWGLGRVAALEHPLRWGGLVDLPDPLDGPALDGLCAVLAGRDGEDQVAVRAPVPLGRRLVPAPEPATPAPAPWTPRGTVLVTGGTGGLGAQVARWLAERGAEHLVLLGRRGPEAPGADELTDALAALGARSTVLACDVTDRAALERVLEHLHDAGETVRAVVHTAGLTSDTPLMDCTPEELARLTAAKTRGAAHLDALFDGRPLDAFVLFSSISGTWGSGGQGAYAAANAYLDGLAAARRGRGLTATSVAWGPWVGAGMAAGAVGEGLRRHGLVPMDPEAALSALGLALALDEGETIVAELDWNRFAPTFGSVRDSALLRGLPTAPEPRAADTATGSGPGTGGEPPWRHRLSRLSEPEGRRLLTELVRSEAATVLGHDSAAGFAADRPFREVGFDSLTAVELRNRLVAATALPLALTSVFDHPTAAALAAHLFTELNGTEPKADGTTGTSGTTGTAEAGSAAAVGGATGPVAADEPLAIVSMACRFPGGVRSPDDLWRLVADGVDAVTELPADRGWSLETLYDPDPLNPGTFYTTGGGFLDGAAEFDAEFFGISPREALAMDPQQRLLLETSWEALERAGLDPSSVRGSEGGVYVGVAAQGYGTGPQNPADEIEGHLLSGTVTSVASGRIAYTLGLGGPAVTVETACSSSLVALHLAGQALRAGDCSFALVGGAAVMASPDVFVEFSRQQGLSPDGRCRSFAEGANGTGWGEGVGVLLVERLSDARRLGHPVLALVRSTAVNQDGASNGLTAPSGPAQQRVIRSALATAGLSGAEIDLVEAHGTGTVLGDPIEAQALLATYGQDRPADRPLWLGSLKSNIGHTQAAAGVAGVIKTVLALRNGVLPGTLHAREASSRVDWSAGAVRLLADARPWDAPDGDRPRRAGVSAFGMSGTNAHAILEEAPGADRILKEAPAANGVLEDAPDADSVLKGAPDADSILKGAPDADSAPEEAPGAPAPHDVPQGASGEPSGDTGATVPWLLSAMTPAALRRQARRLGEHLRAHPDGGVAGPARALATTRPALPFRAAAVGRDRDALLGRLDALAAGEPAPDTVRDRARGGRTVFVFPGQGSQWAGMAVAALDASEAFATAVAACERALAPHTDWSLTEVLRGAPGAPALDRVDVVQPVLFAVMVALAAHWRDTGITPDAVVGHSQGEIAAACVAGALSLDDAALVVALRSRALLKLAGRGGMVSVAASAERTTRLLPAGGGVCVAAVNGPGAVVVAGEPQELAALIAACDREGIRAKAIPVDYAAHSAQVAEIEDELREALTGIRPRASAVPIHSTVTGEPVAGESLDAAYWYRNLREPVGFAGATRTLLEAGHTLFVEVSPHPVLLAGIEDVAAEAGREVSAVGTLRRGDGGRDRLLASLTEAWAAGGGPVDWSPWTGTAEPGGPSPLPLPTYPFERDRYWLPTPGRTASTVAPTKNTTEAMGAVTAEAKAEGTAEAALDDDRTPAVRLAARLAPLDRQARRQAVLDLVIRHAAAVLGHSGAGPVRPERSFSEVGFDSMLAVRFRNALCEATGVAVPPTAVFDHPTPDALAAYLDAELSAAPGPPSPLLAELDRLAALLAAVPPGAAGTEGVGRRLGELLRGWDRRTGTPDGTAPPPGPVDDTATVTETATADELFALLDNDFGNA